MSNSPRLPNPTWMVGCGHMGGAVVEGWRAAGFDLSGLTVIRPSGTAVDGVRTVIAPADAGPAPKIVILAMKPQKLDEVAAAVRPMLSARTILVSLLAGVEAVSLRQRFPGVAAIVRAMPNLPVAIRRGVIALFTPDGDDALRQSVAELFQPLGFAPWVSEDAKLAAVGSVAGAGPAYVARFIAALTAAGEERGLSPEMANIVALETVLGTGWLAAATKWDMSELARRVASPNGTTEAGLAVLDRDGVLDALIGVAIAAAARRGAELAEEAKSSSLAGAAQLS
ncbi:MAG: pyrroline-5-carboxylate reductase dimerization domain-containing protein [Sphingomicrobium sp.]